jgi:hypothetical protein
MVTKMVFFRALILLLPILPLSACAVGDGVAQIVKYASRKTSGDNAAPAVANAAPVRAAPQSDIDAPPPPVAAPRDEIKVEELAPPKF